MAIWRNNDAGTVIDVPDELIAFLGAGWSKGEAGQAPASPPKPSQDGPPPKSGKGSSDANWTTYARAHNVKVTDDMKRADVIAACEAAGVPTE